MTYIAHIIIIFNISNIQYDWKLTFGHTWSQKSKPEPTWRQLNP